MTLQPSWPGVTGLASTTAARKDLAGLIETDASGNARPGVFPAHLNALVTARSDMNVDIAAFQAAAVQFGGPILISNDGTIQLPSVLVSPASGTNYYVVYVKQNESTSPGTDANNNLIAGATLSTVSFAAARSALPTGALELATVQMPSGKTATNASGVIITPTFQYTAAEGGVVCVRTAAELAAWTPANGSRAYRLDTSAFYTRVGGAWIAEFRQLANPGTFITGVDIVQTAADVTPLFRAGMVVSGTAPAFGNGYMPTVALDFPNGILTLVLTEIVADGATKSASGIAYDVYSKTQFRAFYPGDGSSAKRAFSYLAVGY